MSESFKTRAERMNNCLSQLRSLEASLNYWKRRVGDDETEWLLEKADEFIERAAKRIYTEELMGVADGKGGLSR